MMINRYIWFAVAFTALVLSGCNDPVRERQERYREEIEEREKQTQNAEGNKSSLKVNPSKVPVFRGDSAYLYVQKQLAFGPRVPNTLGHVACGEYLYRFFNSKGAWTYKQGFEKKAWDGKMLKLTNYIATYNTKVENRIIIAAHWDTRPYADQDDVNTTKPIAGANDGASGVAVLMELARAIQKHGGVPAHIGLDLILFDGEDYGPPSNYQGDRQNEQWCLGSQHWAELKHRGDYKAKYGILLDMVGGKNATFYQEGLSAQYAPSVVKNVWSTAQALGYGNFFVSKPSPPIIDDHMFINEKARIPMIDIIQYNATDNEQYFAPYWHTHDDNLAAVDSVTLKAVGQTLLQVIYSE
jgi:glutaminyl-peptide cyclotransferase